MSRSRAWCFTINNPIETDKVDLNYHNVTYAVVGNEIGDNGTQHLQGFVYFANPRAFNGVKKLFPRAHIEIMKGTIEQAANYCKKDGDFVEFGDLPKQGLRNDLNEIKDSIMNGISVDTIAMDNPVIYHQYGRTLNKIEDLKMRNIYRTEMTKGEWYFGPSGVGKSELLYKDFKPNECYSYPYDGRWWDGYAQQPMVVIDEFRGQIPFNELLRMCDKHPNYSVARRGREPLPFVSKIVRLSSSMPPWEVYRNVNANDSLAQLYRRFKIYKVTENNIEEVTEDMVDN